MAQGYNCKNDKCIVEQFTAKDENLVNCDRCNQLLEKTDESS